MKYIVVTFNRVPFVHTAHMYETYKQEQYDIPSTSQFIEIAFIEKGAISMRNTNTGVIRTYSEGDIFTTPHIGYVVETITNPHRHYTFSMEPKAISAAMSAKEIVEFSERKITDRNIYVILPLIFNNIDVISLSRKIKMLVDRHNSTDVLDRVNSSSLLLEMLSTATRQSIEAAKQEVWGLHIPLYCQQAMQYISAHINEPISVESIANALNISYGHLRRLFKKQTGFTLVEYINKEKVRKMEEILWSNSMPVSMVAKNVGISDEKYASRLFRKYTGQTISSYIKLYRR